MTLAADTRLGPYEIQGLIGRGGMGEVYRARDSRLGRDVAIKVLPASFSADEDRLRRFDQEARAASALNHPNILTIYDTGTHEGAPYVVMEFLEGQELRALLAHGAMPIRTALEYARDAAQGLAAAHDRGIVHRDLKPENLFVTHDGRLKILDFGLARLGPGGSDAPAGDTATRHALTDPGAVLGTVGYMAPEQVRGTTADHRADIFSLGVVLYEMLAGTRPFVAESPVEVLNAILKDDPASLVDGNPRISQQLDKIVRRCLEKRPEARFQSAHDLGFALDALTMPTTSTANASRLLPVGPDETAPAAAPWWRRVVAPLAAGLAVLAVAAVAWSRWPSPSPVPTVRFDVVMGEEQATFANFNRHVLAVSPDGTRIAYAGDRVYLRSLSESTPQPVPGSDGAISTTHPVFSSDGRSLVFWTAKDRSLKRITLGGGAVTTLCQVPSGPMGLSWAGDYLYFGDVDAGIKRVSANGGEPVVVAAAKDREKLDTPQLLPDGEWLLFTLGRRGLVSWDEAQAVVQSMRTGERRVVLERATNAWYLRSGHLLFGRGGGIFAVPFDLRTLTVRGEPVGVVEGVRRAAPGTSGAVHFAVSDSGTLAYLSGSPQRPEIQVVWNWLPELDARVPVK